MRTARAALARSAHLTHLAREFTLTAALASVCLLALLHAVEYHMRRCLLRDAHNGTGTEAPSRCARIALQLADVEPLTVLQITTACTALVFLGMGIGLRLSWIWASALRTDDAETGARVAQEDMTSEYEADTKSDPASAAR
ncbi:hypothetical protein B0H15DRAFT_930839 [Mycena belliarum]|uniref:Uncharacterized protein n=1 Tax=Mycena belliarum TaxID=1033014 RepID=A0AAD6U8A5_9AGAR|nr:hypothetical protein B0H15DRAFT_930839 [Mycena belliae]